MNTDLLTQQPEAILIDLDQRIKAGEEEVESLKKQRAELERELLESWAANGKQSENRCGVTIYRHRSLCCSGKQGMQEQLRNALVSCGLESLVKEQVVMQSLKSYITENAIETDDGLDYSAIPEEIMDAVNVFEKHSLRIRKS